MIVIGTALAAVLLAPAARGESPPPTARRALLVGVDDHAGRTRDNVGAVGDVMDLRAWLLRAGFADADIRVLVDGAASAQAIRDGLRWLGDSSTDSTLSVFHFSGHVKQMGSSDGDAESLDEHLWASDNRFIADGELAQWIKRIRGRTWIDIAGCEAAGFDDGISAPNRLFTSSSLEHEKSYEHPEWRNSIYGGLMIDQGMLQKRADANRDTRVSIHEAFRFAEAEAPRWTANQSAGPQHPLLAGGDGTEWHLTVPKPPAAERRTCFLILSCGG